MEVREGKGGGGGAWEGGRGSKRTGVQGGGRGGEQRAREGKEWGTGGEVSAAASGERRGGGWGGGRERVTRERGGGGSKEAREAGRRVLSRTVWKRRRRGRGEDGEAREKHEGREAREWRAPGLGLQPPRRRRLHRLHALPPSSLAKLWQERQESQGRFRKSAWPWFRFPNSQNGVV